MKLTLAIDIKPVPVTPMRPPKRGRKITATEDHPTAKAGTLIGVVNRREGPIVHYTKPDGSTDLYIWLFRGVELNKHVEYA